MLFAFSPVFSQDFQGNVLGDEINSSFEELNPRFSPDGKTIYFVRSVHPKNEGGKSAGQDIWMSKKDGNGFWSKAERLADPINNIEHNAVGGISAENDLLILANLYPSAGGFAPGISLVHGEAGIWTDPTQLKAAPETGVEGFFSIYCPPKMDVMLVSMTQGNAGFEDLYFSKNEGSGNWSNLKDLGTEINSPGYETSPFLTEDSRLLFFTTEFLDGQGNGDIFMSFRRDDSWTKWSTPINLGPEVNRTGFDGYFVIAPGGKTAFFISGEKESDPGDLYSIPVAKIPLLTPSSKNTLQEITRQGTPLVLNFGAANELVNFDKTFGYSITGNGWFSMNPKRSEPFVYSPDPSFVGNDTLFSVICRGNNCTSYTTIIKVVKGSPPPLPQQMDTVYVSTQMNLKVRVLLPNENPQNKVYRSIEKRALNDHGNLAISPTGEPFMFTPEYDFAGIDVHEITLCDAEGCRIYPIKIDIEDRFTFGDSPPEISPPTPGMLRVHGNVLDAQSKVPINAEITFVNLESGKRNNLSVKKGTPYSIEIEANASYEVFVSNNDYFPQSTLISPSSNAISEDMERNFELESSPIRINPNDIYALKNVFFDFDKATLQDRSFAPLDSIAEYLGFHPELKAEFRGHTDSRGNDDYNKRLSQNRAQSVVHYLIEKGIDERRLSSRGFGEEKPVADNNTDRGRELNRRVELRLIR